MWSRLLSGMEEVRAIVESEKARVLRCYEADYAIDAAGIFLEMFNVPRNDGKGFCHRNLPHETA